MPMSATGLSLSPHALKAEMLGFDPMIGRKLCMEADSGLLPQIHAVLADRKGEIVLESYGSGPDECMGRPIGDVTFDTATLHDLRSITKAIVSLLYGIALERGEVPRLDTPLLELFPEYGDLAADPERMRRTVEHALTMSLGMEWDEDRPYKDPQNGEVLMEMAPDRMRYVLERPLVAEPGTRWIYSAGATTLIGEILQRGTGRTLPEFAREALFEPLEITRFEWSAGRDGAPSAASGLRLTAPDLLKIGRMVLNDGLCQGRRIVPGAWLLASLRPVIATTEGPDYGYYWLCGQSQVPALGGSVEWFAGFGNGGQRLWLCPRADVAAVIFAGSYDDRSSRFVSERVWNDVILASLEEVRA